MSELLLNPTRLITCGLPGVRDSNPAAQDPQGGWSRSAGVPHGVTDDRNPEPEQRHAEDRRDEPPGRSDLADRLPDDDREDDPESDLRPVGRLGDGPRDDEGDA
ncbi:hypothetical protein GCM10009836_52310 [Pseudonocardia ailaonensis]|uniref:Uncharacterized protein n=1 Tax=Pseudonocardia ailaonensis TaxID=367279 RepID=A0ABN2NE84_9PSEU